MCKVCHKHHYLIQFLMTLGMHAQNQNCTFNGIPVLQDTKEKSDDSNEEIKKDKKSGGYSVTAI